MKKKTKKLGSLTSSEASEDSGLGSNGQISINSKSGSRATHRDKKRRCESLSERKRGLGGQLCCVWYCEIDKYATSVYNHNFKESYKPTDVTTVQPSDIPDFDLLCAGFPCQSFSSAGKRKGFNDTKGILFFEIARIAEAKRPTYLFLENVKGLLNHEKGKTFATILQTLDELGYETQWMVLNSKFFGVPQNRERVFIIGSLRGKRRLQILPFGEGNEKPVELEQEAGKGGSGLGNEVASAIRKGSKRSDTMITSVLDANYHKGGRAGRSMILHNIYGGFNEKKPREFTEHSPTIRTPKGGGHLPVVMEHKKITERTGKYGIGFKEEGSFCLDSSSGSDLVIHPQIRRLTPIECERLQGFPDDWTKYGKDIDGNIVDISDTQRYKMMGNAVTTNVITAIGIQIIIKNNIKLM